MSAGNNDLYAILDEVLPVVRVTGQWIRARAEEHAASGGLEVSSKSDPTDVVTEVDIEAERRIGQALGSRWPGYGWLGEEGGSRDIGAERMWVLDPVDGTRNFVTGHPGYCVSLALVERGQPVLGIVHDIVAEETYTAVRGGGARCNGVPMRVSAEGRAAMCVLGVGLHTRARQDGTNMDRYLRLMHGTAAFRQGGALARDLAYVARGRLDGFWHPDLGPWDAAAGMLLVTEAGGRVRLDVEGDNWLSATRLGLLAGNAAAWDELVALAG